MKEKKEKKKGVFKNILNKKNAQTALELGIFGSILLFMIGAIIRQTMSAGNTQNQQMKALRWAMTMSQRYAENIGSYDYGYIRGGISQTGFGRSSRANANVFVVEDRLSSSSAKYGSVDRVPYITAAGVSHTNQLFYQADDFPLPTETDIVKKIGDKNQLSVIDYFINGQHFIFTTAKMRVICLTHDEADCDQFDPVSGLPTEKYPYHDAWIRNLAEETGIPEAEWWDTQCTTFQPPARFECQPTLGCVPLCPNYDASIGGCIPWDPWIHNANACPYKQFPRPVPCAEFRKRIYNNLTSNWCVQLPTDPTDPCAEGGNLSEDQRFDLDRSGTYVNPPDPVDSDTRQHFSWQWYRVQAFNEQEITKKHKNDKGEIKSIDRGKIYRYPDASLNAGRVPGTDLFRYGPHEEVEGVNTDPEASRNMLVDADFDFKEEGILKILRTSPENIIEKIAVLDFQEGDIDGSINTRQLREDPTLRPGLEVGSTIWTIVGDGTTLLIDEGKLYQMTGGDEKQFIRTTGMRDQIDIIERKIKLSNDTGRFCEDGVPVDNYDGNPGFWDRDNPNPVKVCCGNYDPEVTPDPEVPSCCYDAGFATQTCMDLNELRIYVRSRVKEGRGKKWITESRTLP